jgi:hypothetical protein
LADFNPFGDSKTTVSKTGENLLVSFSPAKFDILIKVLSLFDKSGETISIKGSSIVQKFGTAIANADISTLFDDQIVDLEIVQPKKYIKLFKQFKNNTNIDFIEDNTNNRYVVTNGEIKLFLPKQAQAASDDNLMPDFDDCKGLFEIKIDKETSKQLIGLSGDVNYIEYLIQDDKLKGVHVPDTAIYLFNEFLIDPKASKLDETNADQMLRCGNFLSIPAEDYEINIGTLKNDNYFSVTDCNTGLVHVKIIETLEVTTGGNLLI